MPNNMQILLESLHLHTGKLLTIGNRLLVAIVALGSLYCLFALMVFNLLKHPEQVFHTQAFMFNYSEFAHADSKDKSVTAHMAHKKARLTEDPEWDGTLAGAGIGLTLGRNIPFIGYVAGPVAGAIIGHELDSRI